MIPIEMTRIFSQNLAEQWCDHTFMVINHMPFTAQVIGVL